MHFVSLVNCRIEIKLHLEFGPNNKLLSHMSPKMNPSHQIHLEDLTICHKTTMANESFNLLTLCMTQMCGVCDVMHHYPKPNLAHMN